MQNITKIALCWELYEAGLLKLHIASRLEINRDTVRLWIKGIKEFGFLEFLDQYTKAKKGERVKSQVDPILKRWVQSYIESFNRTVRKECLGWSKYRANQIPELTTIVNQFLDRYHYHRPHIGLGMKVPLER